jgi:hypothetical protein
MRIYLTLLLLIAAAASIVAQDLKPVVERLAAQNALFDEQYETDLRNFPERATAFGDYRYKRFGSKRRKLVAESPRQSTPSAFIHVLRKIANGVLIPAFRNLSHLIGS